MRKKRSVSREVLAARAGISADLLRDMENGAAAPPFDDSLVLKIADAFHFEQSRDFLSLIELNRARKFRAYVVGLVKTGTLSLTGIFGRYWTGHEFNQWETHQMIYQYERNLISFAEYRDFVLNREALSGFLELDSAHFNRHYMEILAGAYPDAKFIFLIRDCFSWVDSFINFFTEPKKDAVQSSPESNGLPFDLRHGDLEARRKLIENFDQYIDAPLSFWARENLKMLERCRRLPNDRFLIVRTGEINDKIEDMARLVGVDPETLRRGRSHLNKAAYHVNILKRLDPRFLEEKFDAHCSIVMNEHFPGYTLKDFLER